ncbi:2'-5' RNA ligase [Amphibacillus marinus]|uniref:RNA 2',3'-cyclic phosphodiesterase n=1 Tax=Amphibacillus marinus TaxID=872970 RepID=A0A1H8SYD2_9BACI|nr:RNA 2',3'-cyclic phosphodiesterase [Amphibacillus marinus]SEO83780.1 2'-5' RNA ligase [Amphibacillus marinus]
MENGHLPHYFIAVELSEGLKKWLALQQSKLQLTIGHNTYKSWTAEADFHITLAFLGALPAQQIEQLMTCMRKQESLLSDTVCIADLHFFGNATGPRVVWFGIAEEQKIMTFYSIVQKWLSNLKSPPINQSFQPHITIAKKCQKKWLTPLVLRKLDDHFSDCYSEHLKAICLYSIDMMSVPKYKCVYRLPLK